MHNTQVGASGSPDRRHYSMAEPAGQWTAGLARMKLLQTENQ